MKCSRAAAFWAGVGEGYGMISIGRCRGWMDGWMDAPVVDVGE
jgi:hypothetical protein